MKQLFSLGLTLIAAILFTVSTSHAQGNKIPEIKKQPELKTYLIERNIPGAGQLSPTDLKGISQKSCTAIKEIGSGIEWIQSYVTGNKIFCLYRAENETLLREHAKKGGFPITTITEVNSTIGPKTAE